MEREPHAAGPPRETLDSHRRCRALLEQLETYLDSAGSGADWVPSVRRRLPDLVRFLEEHFRDEGQAEFHRELPLRRPRYAERLLRLAAEHDPILKRARTLVRRASELEGAPPHAIRDFNGRMQLLLAAIRRHEAEENEAILGAYWEEIGTGD